VEEWGFIRECRIRRGNGLEWFQFNVQQLKCILRNGRGLGQDHGHTLADIPDLVTRERVLWTCFR
jgi:hypothetical protein